MLKARHTYDFNKLGMDPEFEFWVAGEIRHADEFFSEEGNLEDGLYLVDTDFGNIGVDGAGAQLEMRPKPGDPARLLYNIKGCFREFAKLEGEYGGEDDTDFELGIQGDRFPLGAHVHFGFRNGNPGRDCYESEINQFCKVMDWALGRLMLPLSGNARKRYDDYYRLTAWHINEDHGFEYRSLPSAIFASEKALEAVLHISWQLAKHFWRPDGRGIELEERDVDRGMASWDQLMEMLSTEDHLQALQALVYKYNTFSRRIFASWDCSMGEAPQARNRERVDNGDRLRTAELGNGITAEFSDDHWDSGCQSRLLDRLRGVRWARNFPVRFFFFGMARDGQCAGDNRVSIRANDRFYAPRSRMSGQWEPVNCESVNCDGGQIAVGLAYNVRDEVLALEQRLETLVDTLRFVVWELKRQARVDDPSTEPGAGIVIGGLSTDER